MPTCGELPTTAGMVTLFAAAYLRGCSSGSSPRLRETQEDLRIELHYYARFFCGLITFWLLNCLFFRFITSNYEVLTAEFSFGSRNTLRENKESRDIEEDFVSEWKESIKRAVLGKKQGDLTREFQTQTDEMMKTDFLNEFFDQKLVGPGIDMLRYGAWGSNEA